MKRWLGHALVASLVFVACGGGVDSTDGVATLEDVAETTPVTTTTIAFDQEQAVLDLVECLRSEGLDVADPEIDADGNVDMRGLLRQAQESEGQFDPDDIDAAVEACGDLIEQVRLGFTRDLDFTEIQDQLLEFAACMRDNGYDMPDPDFSSFGQGGPGAGGGPGSGPFGQIDPEDPDFAAAFEICQDSLPGFGPGSRLGGGGRP